MLLEDHEDLRELYISLHLQVEQMRYEPGPLLLTLMFLNYLLFFSIFICLSKGVLYDCTFTSVPLHWCRNSCG